MDLDKLEYELLRYRQTQTPDLILELDDMGRVLTYKRTADGTKKPGRPSIWGVERDGRIQWSVTAAEAEAKSEVIAKKQKTTIGSYVTPDEYVLISRYAASLGMTVGAFTRKAVLDAVKNATYG